MLSIDYLQFSPLFYYRSVPSLEPLLQVFGWGLWGNGAYNWIQQGASEQSKQPAQAVGPAGNWRSSAADAIERERTLQRKREERERQKMWKYNRIQIQVWILFRCLRIYNPNNYNFVFCTWLSFHFDFMHRWKMTWLDPNPDQNQPLLDLAFMNWKSSQLSCKRRKKCSLFYHKQLSRSERERVKTKKQNKTKKKTQLRVLLIKAKLSSSQSPLISS